MGEGQCHRNQGAASQVRAEVPPVVYGLTAAAASIKYGAMKLIETIPENHRVRPAPPADRHRADLDRSATRPSCRSSTMDGPA